MIHALFIYLLMTMTTSGAWAAATIVTSHEDLSLGVRAPLPSSAESERVNTRRLEIDRMQQSLADSALTGELTWKELRAFCYEGIYAPCSLALGFKKAFTQNIQKDLFWRNLGEGRVIDLLNRATAPVKIKAKLSFDNRTTPATIFLSNGADIAAGVQDFLTMQIPVNVHFQTAADDFDSDSLLRCGFNHRILSLDWSRSFLPQIESHNIECGDTSRASSQNISSLFELYNSWAQASDTILFLRNIEESRESHLNNSDLSYISHLTAGENFSQIIAYSRNAFDPSPAPAVDTITTQFTSKNNTAVDYGGAQEGRAQTLWLSEKAKLTRKYLLVNLHLASVDERAGESMRDIRNIVFPKYMHTLVTQMLAHLDNEKKTQPTTDAMLIVAGDVNVNPQYDMVGELTQLAYTSAYAFGLRYDLNSSRHGAEKVTSNFFVTAKPRVLTFTGAEIESAQKLATDAIAEIELAKKLAANANANPTRIHYEAKGSPSFANSRPTYNAAATPSLATPAHSSSYGSPVTGPVVPTYAAAAVPPTDYPGHKPVYAAHKRAAQRRAAASSPAAPTYAAPIAAPSSAYSPGYNPNYGNGTHTPATRPVAFPHPAVPLENLIKNKIFPELQEYVTTLWKCEQLSDAAVREIANTSHTSQRKKMNAFLPLTLHLSTV